MAARKKTARKRSPPRTAQVTGKQQISPNMLRITLGGAGLRDFPGGQESAYIKLRLAEPLPGSDDKPLMRTYTVRSFDEQKHELDVDFVLHESFGPAAVWARDCSVGDIIRFSGPGPVKLVDFDADWVLLVGDMSALPAISANIEKLPPAMRGVALIEIIDPADQQDLDAPPNLDVRWVINAHPEEENTILLDAVRGLDWLPGTPSVWVAGEFSQSLAIRNLLRQEHNVSRHEMYASSYWQIGQTEDGHRVSKAQVAD